MLYKTFPEGLVSGPVPDTCKQTPAAGSGRVKKPQTSLSGNAVQQHKDTFSQGDLTAIQDKLDDALLAGGVYN